MTAQGLPIGTRVRKRNDVGFRRLGTVAYHEPEHSRGSFPVRFDDGIWEIHGACDVAVVGLPRGDRSSARAGRAGDPSRSSEQGHHDEHLPPS